MEVKDMAEAKNLTKMWVMIMHCGFHKLILVGPLHATGLQELI